MAYFVYKDLILYKKIVTILRYHPLLPLHQVILLLRQMRLLASLHKVYVRNFTLDPKLDSYLNDLDKQIFVLPGSATRKKLLANNFRIIIDGKKQLTSQQLKHVLPLSKVNRLKSKQLFLQKMSYFF